MLGLGYGLLQGDVFGLSSEDIDYAKGVVHVRRQVQSHKGWLYFTLPKGGKTRVVDMPSSVADELKRHAEGSLRWPRPGSFRRALQGRSDGSGRRRREMASTYCGTPSPRSCGRRESRW